MQLDIFNDSRDVMLRNEVLQALQQQDASQAQSVQHSAPEQALRLLAICWVWSARAATMTSCATARACATSIPACMRRT